MLLAHTVAAYPQCGCLPMLWRLASTMAACPWCGYLPTRCLLAHSGRLQSGLLWAGLKEGPASRLCALCAHGKWGIGDSKWLRAQPECLPDCGGNSLCPVREGCKGATAFPWRRIEQLSRKVVIMLCTISGYI
eukprot:scaffold40466_cov21-Tisochrysis_lutea.AAC.3